MSSIRRYFVIFGFAAICFGGLLEHPAVAAALTFAGSQFDLGDTFYPGYNFPQADIVPWRSDSEANYLSISSDIGNRYYGTAGYALFATRYSFPNADAHPPAANAVINPTTGDPNYPNIVNLPDFVTGSQILGARMAGGWGYALIDDPRMQAGFRQWTFDGTNYPPAAGPCPGESCNVTGVVPFVKLGIIDGLDVFGNNPTLQDPSKPVGIGNLTYRWAFQVGTNVPKTFRIGVMTDGLDSTNFTPTEVQLQQVTTAGGTPTVVQSSTTGAIPTSFGDGRDRFVDMHFFDITNAQSGDQFAFAVRGELGGGHSAGISGFSFDIVDPFVPAVAGDYNGNGIVDAADYTMWRDTLGQSVAVGSAADGDGSGTIDEGDYTLWRNRFGLTSGAGSISGGAVPEPSSAVLLLIALVLGTSRRLW
jgi:hypothetical protein